MPFEEKAQTPARTLFAAECTLAYIVLILM